MVEILDKAEPRFGSAPMAYAWYRSEPLAGFSGQTPMQLVLAGRATDVLDSYGIDPAGLAARDSRDRMRGGTLAPTRRFARTLIEAGFAGLLVRSFARGAAPDDENPVLYAWTDDPASRLQVIDDERRLR